MPSESRASPQARRAQRGQEGFWGTSVRCGCESRLARGGGDTMRPVSCGNFDYDTRQYDLEGLFSNYGAIRPHRHEVSKLNQCQGAVIGLLGM